MTGKALYDKHCTALKQTERRRWDRDAQRYVRAFPLTAPLAWQFLDDDERRYFEQLAKLLTPRRPK